MIAKFDTSGGGGSSTSKGGDNTLIYLAVAVVGGYLLWRYMIKPQMDKKKAEEQAQGK
ncbi:MAG: hypothetical protein WCI04_00395 [archaeon]